jgi:ubiquinol-cytochrome c reductase cytochrome b subunit
MKQKLKNHIITYPTPFNVSYIYSFGFLAGFMLVNQLLTGLILAMFYINSGENAFDSIENIMRNINYGWFLRYLHANGASFFFIILYLHIGKGLYYKSYMYPRHKIWYSGLIIYFLVMATAFLGYVLPWGQMSYWGATVITNLISIVPFIGDMVVEWIWCGYAVNSHTLQRFFVLHYILPFIILALVGVHIVLLHEVGSSNPLNFDKKNEKISFFPYFYIKDFFISIILISCLVIIVCFYSNLFNHADNFIKADELATPHHIVPEWYFLPFYAILRAIADKVLGILLFVASLVIFFFLPVLNSDQNNFYLVFINQTKDLYNKIKGKKINLLVNFKILTFISTIFFGVFLITSTILSFIYCVFSRLYLYIVLSSYLKNHFKYKKRINDNQKINGIYPCVENIFIDLRDDKYNYKFLYKLKQNYEYDKIRSINFINNNFVIFKIFNVIHEIIAFIFLYIEVKYKIDLRRHYLDYFIGVQELIEDFEDVLFPYLCLITYKFSEYIYIKKRKIKKIETYSYDPENNVWGTRFAWAVHYTFNCGIIIYLNKIYPLFVHFFFIILLYFYYFGVDLVINFYLNIIYILKFLMDQYSKTVDQIRILYMILKINTKVLNNIWLYNNNLYYRQLFWLLLIVFVSLGYIGQMSVNGVSIELGQDLTLIYFLIILCLSLPFSCSVILILFIWFIMFIKFKFTLGFFGNLALIKNKQFMDPFSLQMSISFYKPSYEKLYKIQNFKKLTNEEYDLIIKIISCDINVLNLNKIKDIQKYDSELIEDLLFVYPFSI